MYLLGQLCGVIGTVITVIQPQFRRKTQLLVCCILVNAMNALNFLLIGQTGSAILLCLVAIVQSSLSLRHEHRKTEVTTWETALFFLLYVGLGLCGIVSAPGFVWALNRRNLLELLPIVGALMLMFSVFARDEQRTRLFLLLNGAAWCAYTAAVGSTVFFTTVASMASSAIALRKYRSSSHS